VEPYIGNFENEMGFEFTDEFQELMTLPITDMIKKFNDHIESHSLPGNVTDDITTVGMEIM